MSSALQTKLCIVYDTLFHVRLCAAAFAHLSSLWEECLQHVQIEWDESEEQYHAWEAGKTGHPWIDAIMRQLNEIGWMHHLVQTSAHSTRGHSRNPHASARQLTGS
jgi:FAD binding domain of DNA photolyase